ncbi:sodium:proton antiporter, partial [filamentous cyanobacterium CCP5]
MSSLLEHLNGEPIVAFAVLVAVILIVPLLFERINLPGLVGLLAAGILFGPHGSNLLNTEDPVMQLLSDVGLLYLMFVAGLEIDMAEFQKMKYRAAAFGSLTFGLPLLAGTGLGLVAGFPLVSAILVGSLIASHSLLTYPIVRQYEVTRNPAVITTLGGTIFTDIGALIVLAICISAGTGDFTLVSLGQLIIGLAIYALVILLGFDRLGREFFRRSGDNQGNQFLFILLVIFVAAIGAELIGVEKIVGAFLAGLAVNEVVGNTQVKEKIVFVGNVLFIPIFFVDIGLLIDIPAFFSSLRALGFSLSLLAALLISKFLAAFLTQKLFRFRRLEMLTM